MSKKGSKENVSFIPIRRVDNLLFLSGQTCRKYGEMLFTGKVGKELSVIEGEKAAEQCIVNALAHLEDYLGGLDKVRNIIKVNGYIQTAENFTEQSVVMDAASQLLLKTFGERGQHARTAIGVASLPENSAVEIEMIVEIG